MTEQPKIPCDVGDHVCDHQYIEPLTDCQPNSLLCRSQEHKDNCPFREKSEQLRTLPFSPDETVSVSYYVDGKPVSWSGTMAEAVAQGHIVEETMVQEGEHLVFYFNRVAIAQIKTDTSLRCHWLFFEAVDGSAFGHMDRNRRRFHKDVELLVSPEYISQNKIAVEQ